MDYTHKYTNIFSDLNSMQMKLSLFMFSFLFNFHAYYLVRVSCRIFAAEGMTFSQLRGKVWDMDGIGLCA